MPQNLIQALYRHGATGLTLISNTAGIGGTFGTKKGYTDLSLLMEEGRVKKVIASYPVSPSPSRPTAFERLYLAGKVELELCAQGTLAERIRAGGAGIGGFYTPTGIGTPLEEGKERRFLNGRWMLLELALRADYALIRAYKADRLGNLIYRGTSRSFNPVMAPAAKVTIAEVDQVVEPGELDPEAIITPSLFVHRVVAIPQEGR